MYCADVCVSAYHEKIRVPPGPRAEMVGERCVSQRSPRRGLLAVRMGMDWSPRLISFQTGIFSGRESAANSPGRAHQAMTLTFPWMLEDIVGSLTHDRWLKGLERSAAKPFRSITTVMSARDSFVCSLEFLKLSYLNEKPKCKSKRITAK